MLLTETNHDLKLKFDQLTEENRELLLNCKNLEVVQSALELAIAENNSKQLQAEMISMELEQIFLAVTDALWVISDEGIVIRANEAMLKLLNKPLENVIDHKCSDLLNSELCQQDSCPLQVTKNKIKQEYDIQLSGEFDCLEHYILSAAPLTTIVGSTGVVCQFKNITSRKKTEQKLEELNEKLKLIATIDGLTQIANRRCFDETINQEWKRLTRDKKPLSLLLADIDFFKKFNDHYGHPAGDDCLRQVGKTLTNMGLRPADLAARYGGEEFVLLLPEVELDGALHVGNRVLEAITQMKIEHSHSDVSDFVTMSLGAATLIPATEHAPEDLIALADKALYQSKHDGRNRVTAAMPEQNR